MLWFTKHFGSSKVSVSFQIRLALKIMGEARRVANRTQLFDDLPAPGELDARALCRPYLQSALLNPFDDPSSRQPFEWGQIWQPHDTSWRSECTFRHIFAWFHRDCVFRTPLHTRRKYPRRRHKADARSANFPRAKWRKRHTVARTHGKAERILPSWKDQL